jgi:hypothetical protein
MRRTVVTCVLLAAFAVPATALAVRLAPGDGTLVIQNGNASRGPVVTLVLRGAAIGQITGFGRLVIQDLTPNNGAPPEVTGFAWHKSIVTDKVTLDTADVWGVGITDTVRFRAVGDTYRITIYGSDVDLVASGNGNAIVAGSPDDPAHDGRYSLNGGDFHSLPATQTKLTIAVPASAAG